MGHFAGNFRTRKNKRQLKKSSPNKRQWTSASKVSVNFWSNYLFTRFRNKTEIYPNKYSSPHLIRAYPLFFFVCEVIGETSLTPLLGEDFFWCPYFFSFSKLSKEFQKVLSTFRRFWTTSYNDLSSAVVLHEKIFILLPCKRTTAF